MRYDHEGNSNDRKAASCDTVHSSHRLQPHSSGEPDAALRDAGREDRVAGHLDNLALGPINPPDLQTRQRWMREELRTGWECGYPETGWGLAEAEAFWTAALAGDVRRVA